MIALVATHRPSAWIGAAIVFVLVGGFGILPAVFLAWTDERKGAQS